MTRLRVVHYLNQFFAGIGAEDKADTPPGQHQGPIGPGRLLQQALGDRGQVVATVYCGDNYMAEKPTAIDEVRCSNCGEASPAGSRFCSNCGSRLGSKLGEPPG